MTDDKLRAALDAAANMGPCSQTHHGFIARGCSEALAALASVPDEGPLHPSVVPIYCTGACDACRAYAAEIGAPLIVPPPPATAPAPATTDAPEWMGKHNAA